MQNAIASSAIQSVFITAMKYTSWDAITDIVPRSEMSLTSVDYSLDATPTIHPTITNTINDLYNIIRRSSFWIVNRLW